MYNFGQWDLQVNLLWRFLGKPLASTKRDRHDVVLPLFNFAFVFLPTIEMRWLELKQWPYSHEGNFKRIAQMLILTLLSSWTNPVIAYIQTSCYVRKMSPYLFKPLSKGFLLLAGSQPCLPAERVVPVGAQPPHHYVHFCSQIPTQGLPLGKTCVSDKTRTINECLGHKEISLAFCYLACSVLRG